jgi:dihydrofolate reductase
MGRLVVNMSVTLDGVMQAPGRSDEDTRGGFRYGGWALPYFDPVMVPEMGEGTVATLLFGRRTYEDFHTVWAGRTDNPFSGILDAAIKHVASTTLKEPLSWRNSTLLSGDVPAKVARLKEESDRDIGILGSGALVRFLMPYGLVDEYVLSIHPLVLGSGQRLFDDRSPFAALDLVDSKTTSTGVVIATYNPGLPRTAAVFPMSAAGG